MICFTCAWRPVDYRQRYGGTATRCAEAVDGCDAPGGVAESTDQSAAVVGPHQPVPRAGHKGSEAFRHFRKISLTRMAAYSLYSLFTSFGSSRPTDALLARARIEVGFGLGERRRVTADLPRRGIDLEPFAALVLDQQSAAFGAQ